MGLNIKESSDLSAPFPPPNILPREQGSPLLLLFLLISITSAWKVVLSGGGGEERRLEGYLGADGAAAENHFGSFRFRASSASIDAHQNECICLTTSEAKGGLGAATELRCWLGPQRLGEGELRGEVVGVAAMGAENASCTAPGDEAEFEVDAGEESSNSGTLSAPTIMRITLISTVSLFIL